MADRRTARSLGRLSSRWLDRRYPFRRKALAAMAREFPNAMGERLLDALFSEMTEKKLVSLLRRDRGLFFKAAGGLAVHVVPSNIPNPSVTSVVLGLLAGADNAVKISRRDSGLLPVYLASLRAHDPALASKVSLFSSRKQTLSYLKKAALVIVYGSDQTVAQLKKLTPKGMPFIGYGHRVSLAVFGRGSLSPRLARAAAHDAWMMDGRGCMSPEVFFVQRGGKIAPEAFAAALGKELDRLEGSGVSFTRALHLKSARDRRLVSALRGTSVSARVEVRVFDGLKELLPILSRYRRRLQAAAVEGADLRRRLTAKLKALGASRVCPAGRMQHPPLSWDHEKVIQ